MYRFAHNLDITNCVSNPWQAGSGDTIPLQDINEKLQAMLEDVLLQNTELEV